MMDNENPVTDPICLCAAQVRLIAGLMMAGASLQKVESEAFALMLQDLAERLERITGKTVHCLDIPNLAAGEERP